MKKLIMSIIALCCIATAEAQTKKLVAYFSGTGTTKGVAEEIQRLTGADIYRIEPSEPYSSNPYNDSDRIQNEAYNNLRPGVANLPESLDEYDVIFVGSPIWWHYPAMVVCTFLESYDLTGKTIVPFFTYAATTYFQQAVNKIIEVTPNSTHLTAFGSSGSTRNVESWLTEIGQIGSAGISNVSADDGFSVSVSGETVNISASNDCTIEAYTASGTLIRLLTGSANYTLQLPQGNVYLLSAVTNGKRTTKKVVL